MLLSLSLSFSLLRRVLAFFLLRKVLFRSRQRHGPQRPRLMGSLRINPWNNSALSNSFERALSMAGRHTGWGNRLDVRFERWKEKQVGVSVGRC